jgi:aryl-alcohol dehydrogenase-like predicted oxidoreductase
MLHQNIQALEIKLTSEEIKEVEGEGSYSVDI